MEPSKLQHQSDEMVLVEECIIWSAEAVPCQTFNFCQKCEHEMVGLMF